MHIVRQRSAGEWGGVIAQVGKALVAALQSEQAPATAKKPAAKKQLAAKMVPVARIDAAPKKKKPAAK
jgi:hypothetical protein